MVIISFFEEFPTKENVEKIKLINFPSKLYIGAYSLEEFKKIKVNIKSKWIKETIYWPLLTLEEGYWMSPFTKRKALLRTIKEAKNEKVMWDCELPKKRFLLLTNALQFFKNKRIINRFFKEHKEEIYTAEYFPLKGPIAFMMRVLGLSFSPKKYNNKMIKMIYSSMHDHGHYIIEKEVKAGKEKYGNKYLVGLGTIATGILGNEPKLSLEKLERDLKICKKAKIKEVIIFRLGGLDKEYVGSIKKFV